MTPPRYRRSTWVVLLLGATLAGAAVHARQSAGQEAVGPSATEVRLRTAELLAGLTPVEGPGLVVVLRHSPRPARGISPDKLQVREQDLNAVVNALRAGGAEALGLQGAGQEDILRLHLGSVAVDEGNGVQVSGVRLRAPYRIIAIGDARTMRSELMREGGVVKQAGLEALNMIEIHGSVALKLPAAPPRELRYARRSGEPPRDLGLLSPPAVAPTSPSVPAPRTQEPDAPRKPASPPASTPSPPAAPPVITRPPPRQPAANSGTPGPNGERYFAGTVRPRYTLNYHAVGCRFGERIPVQDRVYFALPGEAERAGLKGCVVCSAREASRR